MVLPIAALMIGLGVKNKYDADKRDAADAEDDRAFKQETRARQREAYQRDDALRTSMEQAGKPVTVDAAPVAPPIGSRDAPRAPEDQGMRVGDQTFTDPAAAQKAAAAENTPEATMERQAAVLSAAGKPLDAAHLRTANRAEQMGKIQLDEAQRKHVDELFTQSLNRADSHQALAQLMSDSKGDGQGGSVKFSIVVSPDGKSVSYVRVNPDGTQTALPGSTFPNDAKGLEKAKLLLNEKVPTVLKLTHLHQQAQEEQQAAQLAEQTRHNQAVEGTNADKVAAMLELGQARNEIARLRAEKGAAGAAPGPAPVWDDKADAFLRQRYVVKDETTGQVQVDGAGMKFAKTIALAKAKANGGDTTIALGEAFDVDQRLRAAAKGDQNTLNTLRGQYLQRLTAPPAPAPASPVATMAPAARPAAAPAAPAASMQAVADPMAERMAVESSELNRGTRTDFSPEVKLYIERRRAAEAAAAATANESARERERARAIARSKEQAAANR